MTIRNATADDLDEMNRLFVEGRSFLPCIQDKKRKKPATFSQIVADPQCYGACFDRLYCIVEGGEVVGFVAAYEAGSNAAGDMVLRHLVIEEGDNAEAMAKQVVSELERHIAERDVTVVFSALFERIVLFWQALGYEQTEPLSFDSGDIKIVLGKHVA